MNGEQDPFLKLVRDCAAVRITPVGEPLVDSESEEVINYINSLSNWSLLVLLAEAAAKE